MSNILIIKHGSLGDITQISGVLKDIKINHKDKKIFILTTSPYADLLAKSPYIDGVLIDRRLPRWNIIYLLKLKKIIKRMNFIIAYDLQNSSRTSFYKKYLFDIPSWSSTETTLEKGTAKIEFDKESVLERFKLQLEKSNIKTYHTLKPDFTWACESVDQIINKFFNKKFILIFPFCSPKLAHKKWPYYNQLIEIIKKNHSKIEIILAPSPSEIDEAKNINALTITNNSKALNISELAGLIKKSSFIVSNDTGPAHMSAHLGVEGISLFGHHTTPKKVSIETEKFKAIMTDNLKKLTAESVYLKIKDKLDLITY